MTKEDNIFFAKRKLIDNIYKSANLEGIAVTFADTYSFMNNVNTGNISIDDMLKLKGLKDAWEYVLNTIDEDFSDEVYECLLSKNLIPRSLKKTKADMLAISLGFVFDFNFPISYQILRNSKYYDKEIEIYIHKSNNEEFKKKLENLKNVINKYIDGRCNNVR